MAEVGGAVHLAFEIAKRDDARRIIEGVATAETPDKVGDILDYEGSLAAFAAWPGNVREMHDPKKAIGKCLEWRGDPTTRQIRVKLQISKSRDGDDAWAKIQEGVLTGLSVKGPVLEPPVPEIVKTASGARHCRRFRRWRCDELSLVDNPCHQDAALFPLVKAADGGLALAHPTEGKTMDENETTPADAENQEAVAPGAVVSKAAAGTDAAAAYPDTPAWGAPPAIRAHENGPVINKPAPVGAVAAIAEGLEKASGIPMVVVPGLPAPLVKIDGTGYHKFASGPQAGALMEDGLVAALVAKAAAMPDPEEGEKRPEEKQHEAPKGDTEPDSGSQTDESDADSEPDGDGDGEMPGDDEDDDDKKPKVEKAAVIVGGVDLATISAIVSAAVAAALGQPAPAPVEKAAVAAPKDQPDELAKALGAVEKLTAELGQVREELEKVKAQPAKDPNAPATRQLPSGVVPDEKTIGGAPQVGAADGEAEALQKQFDQELDPIRKQDIGHKLAVLEVRKVFGAVPR